jgi:hypothetical protein
MIVWVVLGVLIATGIRNGVGTELVKDSTSEYLMRNADLIYWGLWFLWVLILGAFVLFGIALRKGQKS